MLADQFNIPQSGRLDPDIQLPYTAKQELISFIAEALPHWRDNPDRKATLGENKLTEQLCDYLNSAVYYSLDWSHVQFRTETSDETCSSRRIDLTVKPRAAALIIEGRRHSQFDALFPIECKRLPTPKGRNRDQREYVTNEPGTTGGIQRFKLGYHGAAHKFAAMIAYVQDQTLSYWMIKVNCWIRELAKGQGSAWSEADMLQQLGENLASDISMLKSEHQRAGGLGGCELRHLWVRMR